MYECCRLTENNTAEIDSLTLKLTDHLKNNHDCQCIREETIRILREMSELIGQPQAKRRELFYGVPKSGRNLDARVKRGPKEQVSNAKLCGLFEQLKGHLKADEESALVMKNMLRDIENMRCGESDGFGKPYQYLIGYGILNEFITLTGINKFGFTVLIGSKFKSLLDADLKSAVETGNALEHGLDPEKFANALQEELDLLNCVCSKLAQPSDRDYRRMNRLCFNALQREYENL